MPPQPTSTNNTNTKVTIAVLAANQENLIAEVRGYRADTKAQMAQNRAECVERYRDHEDRLRVVEGSNRQGLYRDLSNLLAALGAALFGWLVKAPPSS